jgi:hypothetical protein
MNGEASLNVFQHWNLGKFDGGHILQGNDPETRSKTKTTGGVKCGWRIGLSGFSALYS